MLKLYVVGNTSSNPNDWSEWDEIALVLAETSEQALTLTKYPFKDVVEIPITGEAKLLYQTPSPELWWGEDA